MTAKPEESLDLEPSWYDDPPPPKHKKKPVYLEEDEITKSRDELFETGSSFMHTERSEIVGINNVLDEIDMLIHWLRNSSKYQKYNSRLEPGVIFEGDPGTGKTLVSRYIASASDALFINVRDFAHNGVLFKDSDIADLFTRARTKYEETEQPIVLFWDEFETGAADRSSAPIEVAAAVSQLTAELDGIHGKNEGILLIGCTNYIHSIDAALRRSGRMGLQIEFHAPDRVGKKLLLEYYIGQYKTKGKIDCETLSYFFGADATAADIEEACVEAWRLGVYRTLVADGNGRPALTQQDLIQVFLKRLVGPPATFINLPKEDRARIAVHECGHAIMALVYNIPLRLITVQPGKKSLGRVITAETTEHIGTYDEMISEMRVCVGSIAAELESGLPASLGATGDVDSMNSIAVKLVDMLAGGSDSGLFNPKAVAIGRMHGHQGPSPNVSTSFIERSDNDVATLLNGIQSDSQRVMASIGKDRLWKLANRVNDEVTLTGEEFEKVFRELVGDPFEFRP